MNSETKILVIVKTPPMILDRWVYHIASLMPEFNVKRWDDAYSFTDVKYIICWMPDALWINQFPNLKAVVSLGSGVDHIKNLNQLRGDIPVIRTVSEDLIQKMREYLALMVLGWHRNIHKLIDNSRNANWQKLSCATSSSIRVGVMGYGRMGSPAADTLANLGYKVSVWANQNREETRYHITLAKTKFKNLLQNSML